MPAQTGRTNAKYIGVFLKDSGGTLRDITPYCDNVGTVGLKYDESDVTAFSDGTKNIVIGRPEAPIKIGGPFDTVLHGYLTGVNGVQTPLTLDIRVGIRQTWVSGEPEFGLSSSATSGYLVSSYLPNLDSMTWTAMLNVIGPTAPAWGTTARV